MRCKKCSISINRTTEQRVFLQEKTIDSEKLHVTRSAGQSERTQAFQKLKASRFLFMFSKCKPYCPCFRQRLFGLVTVVVKCKQESLFFHLSKASVFTFVKNVWFLRAEHTALPCVLTNKNGTIIARAKRLLSIKKHTSFVPGPRIFYCY